MSQEQDQAKLTDKIDALTAAIDHQDPSLMTTNTYQPSEQSTSWFQTAKDCMKKTYFSDLALCFIVSYILFGIALVILKPKYLYNIIDGTKKFSVKKLLIKTFYFTIAFCILFMIHGIFGENIYNACVKA